MNRRGWPAAGQFQVEGLSGFGFGGEGLGEECVFAGDVFFAVDPGAVVLDGAQGEFQLFGDLGAAVSLEEEVVDLLLAF